MTVREFEALLATAINEAGEPGQPGASRVETFEEAGILTHNRGLVVTFDDGSEFQLTIVRSQHGRVSCSESDDDAA